MSIYEYVALIVSIVFEAFIVDSFFFSMSGGRRLSTKKTFLIYAGFILAFSLISIFIKPALAKASLLFVFIVGLSLLYRQSSQRQIFSSIIIFIAINLIELLVGFILSAFLKLTVSDILNTQLYFIVGIIVSKLMTYGAVKIFGIYYKKSDGKIKFKMFTLFLIFPILTFLIGVVLIGIAGVNTSATVSAVSAISIMLLALSNILIFYLFEQNIRQLHKENKAELKNQMLTLEKSYLEKLVAEQTKSNKVEHDIKNQLFAIAGLLQNNSGNAKNAINKIYEDITAKQKMIFVNNISVDALINSKMEIMLQKNIQFLQEIFISDLGNINEIDLCVVFGNMLDNAIEACAMNELTNANKIILSFKDDENYIKILIKNTIDKKVEIENNSILTKKKDKYKHGFGIANAKEIASRYSGNVVLTCDDKFFAVSIIMKKQIKNTD